MLYGSMSNKAHGVAGDAKSSEKSMPKPPFLSVSLKRHISQFSRVSHQRENERGGLGGVEDGGNCISAGVNGALQEPSAREHRAACDGLVLNERRHELAAWEALLDVVADGWDPHGATDASDGLRLLRHRLQLLVAF
ncbi:hypothetical protein EVG20_g11151 [Dentipellis fragilis]|uniref:Uncharacterized protein n=1 Tax=Dentipellis fragilis TaxID=205917 RepID=A0A4Y9XN02_9AGAM|nr:hypothetical protein EVG20_g11151 [Dentipellis fragilis]